MSQPGDDAINGSTGAVPNERHETSGVRLAGILRKGRVARPVEDLDDDTLSAIAGAAVPESYAHLDQLVQDWTP